jgi:hypothetical protein
MMSDQQHIQAWFAGRIPDGWFTGPVRVEADRDEVIVLGELPEPEVEGGDAEPATARSSRIEAFREESRQQRMRIARDAEGRFGRKVSWGARCGDVEALFTHLAAPAMTRLKMPERKVLDLLVESGVARSRSDALAWCVRLVGRHEADWLAELHDALAKVREVRGQGPDTA